MDMLSRDGKGAMLFLTALMEEERKRAQEEDGQMEEDQVETNWSTGMEDNEWQDEGQEASTLQKNINMATDQLQFDSEGAEILSSDSKEDSKFQEKDMSVHSHDLDLSLEEYKSDAQEVSSGEFDTTHTQKYVNPTTFQHALWNAAGPSVGVMVTCLDIIKDELEGELAGVLAEFKNQPEQLISLL